MHVYIIFFKKKKALRSFYFLILKKNRDMLYVLKFFWHTVIFFVIYYRREIIKENDEKCFFLSFFSWYRMNIIYRKIFLYFFSFFLLINRYFCENISANIQRKYDNTYAFPFSVTFCICILCTYVFLKSQYIHIYMYVRLTCVTFLLSINLWTAKMVRPSTKLIFYCSLSIYFFL